MTLQGHLAKAWAHLQQAQDIARTQSSRPTVLVQWIDMAIDNTELAVAEAREIRAEEDTAIEAAVRG